MIISYKTLQEHFGGNSIAEVTVNLQKANVKFLLGKGLRPFTTETALNHAMGLIEGVESDVDRLPIVEILWSHRQYH